MLYSMETLWHPTRDAKPSKGLLLKFKTHFVGRENIRTNMSFMQV
jgi:hypothetical protein